LKLKALCERYGILFFIEQEESYTSKASFLECNQTSQESHGFSRVECRKGSRMLCYRP
jgi:hypothetical protein